ncbi:MAG: protein-glutamate O-methyltransferase CheR [Candidatus Omnitrophota bacterium]
MNMDNGDNKNEARRKTKQYDELNDAEKSAFDQILEDLHIKRNVDFRQYRYKCMCRRILVRMHDNHMDSIEDYLKFLRGHSSEYDRLLEVITINVSEFFRNPETFSAVRNKVIPELLEKKKKEHARIIKVWSAGCATGEEPYSISIMLKEILREYDNYFTPIIYATDIDDEALAKARAGMYANSALKELTPAQISTYFTKLDDDLFRIKPEIKAIVKFSKHNMISDAPLKSIDIVFCRNVLIYFNKALQKKVYENFFTALYRGGYVVAGKVETMIGIADHMYDRVDVAERIFRKP